LAEEYDPQRKRLAGNFPQALSHIALLSTALNLTHPLKPSEQRSDQQSAANCDDLGPHSAKAQPRTRSKPSR
jgi:hypothetical protein